MDMRKLVGENVRRLRSSRGMTQEYLAEVSGFSQQYISDLERGRRNPTVVSLFDLAQALETTSVCEIPFERLDELSVQLPQLRRQLMRVMSREIRDDQQMMLLLSKKTADERIATFLVNLSARFRARGFSANQFRLSMSRNEIGNHLGFWTVIYNLCRVLDSFVISTGIRIITVQRHRDSIPDQHRCPL